MEFSEGELDELILQSLKNSHEALKVLLNLHTAIMLIKRIALGWKRKFLGIGSLPDIPDDEALLKELGFDKSPALVRGSLQKMLLMTPMMVWIPLLLASSPSPQRRMISFSKMMGNDKPPLLAMVEHQTWKFCCEMAENPKANFYRGIIEFLDLLPWEQLDSVPLTHPTRLWFAFPGDLNLKYELEKWKHLNGKLQVPAPSYSIGKARRGRWPATGNGFQFIQVTVPTPTLSYPIALPTPNSVERPFSKGTHAVTSHTVPSSMSASLGASVSESTLVVDDTTMSRAPSLRPSTAATVIEVHESSMEEGHSRSSHTPDRRSAATHSVVKPHKKSRHRERVESARSVVGPGAVGTYRSKQPRSHKDIIDIGRVFSVPPSDEIQPLINGWSKESSACPIDQDSLGPVAGAPYWPCRVHNNLDLQIMVSLAFEIQIRSPDRTSPLYEIAPDKSIVKVISKEDYGRNSILFNEIGPLSLIIRLHDQSIHPLETAESVVMAPLRDFVTSAEHESGKIMSVLPHTKRIPNLSLNPYATSIAAYTATNPFDLPPFMRGPIPDFMLQMTASTKGATQY
ncbi:hypothetical protein H1R20_g800, partial [Candolleomyces eurysporus]